jgi:hypothetical protein
MVAVVAVVIVIVPVALRSPTMPVFIPPAMAVIPAMFTRFAQLGARMVGLAAFASMMLDGFVKAMVSLGDSMLAIVVIGLQTRSAAEKQESRQCRTGQRDLSRPENSRLQFCLHPVLLFFEMRPKKQGSRHYGTVDDRLTYREFREDAGEFL